MEKIFESILVNTTVAGVKEEANGIRVTFKPVEGSGRTKQTEKVFDKILVSVGRKPNSEITGLDKTKVKVIERGFIQVNKQLQTGDPAIYAIGDIAGEPMLAHKAAHEGTLPPRSKANRRPQKLQTFEPNAIPGGSFHRSRNRMVRAHRDAGAKRKPRSEGCQVSLGSLGPSHHARPLGGLNQAGD